MRTAHDHADTETRVQLLQRQLQASFHPLELEIRDDGAQHIGHHHEGGGHFSVRIVAPAFAAHTALQRHRMIYAALGNLLQTDIHALSIQALAPGESTDISPTRNLHA